MIPHVIIVGGGFGGHPRGAAGEKTESLVATSGSESPARTDRLMEEVCKRENLKEAFRQVKGNKGSAGVDGITVNQLTDYLKQHWPVIREQLLSGTYEPKPVRRVEIPKPDGGVRKLGIPNPALPLSYPTDCFLNYGTGSLHPQRSKTTSH